MVLALALAASLAALVSDDVLVVKSPAGSTAPNATKEVPADDHGAASELLRRLPTQLLVSGRTINHNSVINGVYELLPGLRNGWPAWRKASPHPLYLFRSASWTSQLNKAVWAISTHIDGEDGVYQRVHCLAYLETPSIIPDVGEWMLPPRPEEDAVADPNVRVQSSPAWADALQVNGRVGANSHLNGVYYRMPEMRNGWPVWQQTTAAPPSGRLMIFHSATRQLWVIHDQIDGSDRGFAHLNTAETSPVGISKWKVNGQRDDKMRVDPAANARHNDELPSEWRITGKPSKIAEPAVCAEAGCLPRPAERVALLSEPQAGAQNSTDSPRTGWRVGGAAIADNGDVWVTQAEKGA